MDALRRVIGPAPIRARAVLVMAVAVAAVIAGLLAMHVLSSASHPSSHDSAPTAVHAAAAAERPAPVALGCGVVGCDELGLMVVACALALLAVAAIVPLVRGRWTIRAIAPPLLAITAAPRAVPRPSLIRLSISRT
ncbi:DUF6153 family protein [Agrococcus pavilionensis]|uniref:DUF6153 family protein n=1 Tax=Agrococcus pavilionensis TaxID=1346502 RepID=UPI0003A073ED|nr:DUF6153 family protein [Agrococcus pavilionensis]